MGGSLYIFCMEINPLLLHTEPDRSDPPPHSRCPCEYGVIIVCMMMDIQPFWTHAEPDHSDPPAHPRCPQFMRETVTWVQRWRLKSKVKWSEYVNVCVMWMFWCVKYLFGFLRIFRLLFRVTIISCCACCDQKGWCCVTTCDVYFGWLLVTPVALTSRSPHHGLETIGTHQ
jgi:hypothetical protein